MSQRNNSNIYIYLAIALIIGMLLGRLSFYYSDELPRIYSRSGSAKLLKLIDLINQQYVDNVRTDSIVDDVITRVLKDLDPHSLYFSPSEYRHISDETHGEFKGIGITYNSLLDTPIILTVLEHSPAQEKGLLPGDIIGKINGIPTYGIDIDSITRIFASLHKVNLVIERKSADSVFEVSMEKRKINLPSLYYYRTRDSICYVMINNFSLRTYDEFKSVMDKCLKNPVKGIILDLRENSGGTLSSAYEVVQEFFPKGTLLFYIKSKNQIRKKFVSSRDGRLKDIPLVVLISSSTASASELIAGAVKDNDRGVIIGTRSFGKGLVQTEYQLPDGSVVRLTTAKYYTPSGRCLQKPYSYYNNPILSLLDSIPQDTTEKFYTHNGRIIYGHGGITPDIRLMDTLPQNTLAGMLLFNRTIVNHAWKLRNINTINDFERKLDTLINAKDFRTRFVVQFQLIKSFLGQDSAFAFFNQYSPPYQKALEVLSDTALYNSILQNTRSK